MEKQIEYPTQEEAQFMIDWLNAIDTSIYSGFLRSDSDEKKLWDKVESMRIKQWQTTFGDNSPWRAEMKRFRKSKKLVLAWDKVKAERLGL